MKWLKKMKNEDVLFLIILIVVIPILIILYKTRNKEYEQCHKETKGKLNGFSLYSNKIVEIDIEYFINDVRYETSIPCGEHLRGFFYSKEKDKVIGKPCTVYYACDNFQIFGSSTKKIV